VDKKIIINASSNAVNIAMLEDDSLVELHKETKNKAFVVADIYLGRTKKIVPGLNAAFVDVGYKKDGFLHYQDLGPNIRSLLKLANLTQNKPRIPSLTRFRLEKETEKDGKISDILRSGLELPVQIVKEPISTKGPRLSCELSLAGRYMVLVPFSNKVSISQKISSGNEKNRLKKLIQSIRPKNFGVIVRTAADNMEIEELEKDMQALMDKWRETLRKLKKAQPKQRLLSEVNLTSAILRDLFSDSVTNVIVDDSEIYQDIIRYIKMIAPEKVKSIKLHKANTHIFDHYNVNKQIKTSFGKTVTIKRGVYLIIEHTEAMHVIDINSGNKVDKNKSQEENALRVNLESAKEIARQLRLRDIGGIIVIDFIDLHKSENRQYLYKKLKEEMKKDRARHSILPPSKFGLVQITRERVRPVTEVVVTEVCPTCKGTGKITSSSLIIDSIESDIKHLLQEQNEKKLTLVVHPYIYAYLTKGIYSLQWKWYFRFNSFIRLKQDMNMPLLSYTFYNKNNVKIKM
jgi:ribonuclease G